MLTSRFRLRSMYSAVSPRHCMRVACARLLNSIVLCHLHMDGSAPPVRRSRRGRKGGGRVMSQGMQAGVDPLTSDGRGGAGRGLKISTDSGPVETADMKIY